MLPLEPPATFIVAACEGWLELGNAREALAEWDKLDPRSRRHRAALELRWVILARLGDWDAAVEAGDILAACVPESSAGWLHRAYAVRRAKKGGLEHAWEALRPAADLFPDDETIAYNLACYATQLGRPDEGWEWFLRALQISRNRERIRTMALEDPDLEPLLPRIRQLG